MKQNYILSRMKNYIEKYYNLKKSVMWLILLFHQWNFVHFLISETFLRLESQININVTTCTKIYEPLKVLRKSMDWFLYDNGLRHERIKDKIISDIRFLFESNKEDYYQVIVMLLAAITLSMKAMLIEIKHYQLMNIFMKLNHI